MTSNGPLPVAINLNPPRRTDSLYTVPNSCINTVNYQSDSQHYCNLINPNWSGVEFQRVKDDTNLDCYYQPTMGDRAQDSGFAGKRVVCDTTNTLVNTSSTSLQQNATCCVTGQAGVTGGTCSLTYTNLNSPNCELVVTQYCTGEDLSLGDTSWHRRWDTSGICYSALEQYLFIAPDDSFKLLPPIDLRIPNQSMNPIYFNNSEGFNVATDLMTKTYQRYTNDGQVLGTYPDSIGFSPFQNNFYSICQNVPGICQRLLNTACVGVTEEQLSVQPYLTPFCGCYMNPTQYSQYTNQWGITKQCTPFCNLPVAIPLVGPGGTVQQYCNQDTCIINNYTVNLINSNSSAVNINQICGGCTSANCTCLIDGLSLTFYNSRVNGQISLTQDCQTPQCSIYNPITGQYQNVPCQDNKTPQQIIDELNKPDNTIVWETVIIWLIIFIILFGLLLILAWLGR